MEHEENELKRMLKEIYPEIEQHNLELDMEYKHEKEYWIVKLERGDFKLHTFLDKKDAEVCLGGVGSVSLGVQIAQFASNLNTKDCEEKAGNSIIES